MSKGSLDNDTRPRIDGYVQPQLNRRPPFSVEASGYEKKEGETIPRRHPLAKDHLITQPSSEVKTIFDNLKRAASKFGNAKAIGTRKILKTHVENKKVKKIIDGQEQEVDKKWTYYELSGYEYMSFIEYEKLALDCGAGLRGLGISKENKMHLYGATRYVDPVFARLLVALFSSPLTPSAPTGWPCRMPLPLSPSPS